MRDLTEIEGIIRDIKERLIDVFGSDIKEVVLYGSFARGEATSDSDIDLAVIIEDNLEAREVEKRISGYLFDLLLEKEELISVVAIPEEMYRNYRMPVITAVKREGKPV